MNRKEGENEELRTGEIREYDAAEKDEAQEAFQRTGKKEEGTPIYLTDDATLQSPEEDRKDTATDPTKDNTIAPSEDDLH